MKSLKFKVGNPQGMHLKPSSAIAQVAMGFSAKISIAKGEVAGDAKSVIGIIGLQAAQGSDILIQAEGEDEEKAISALKKVVADELTAKFSDMTSEP